MRAPAPVWILAIVVAGLALAATLQTRHDESVSSRQVLAAWRSIGGSLVQPTLYNDSADTGLDCFAYRATRGLAETELCFDSARRLVEALRETAQGTSLASVLTSPDRAPVSVSAATLTAGRKVAALDTAIESLREGLGRCGKSVLTAEHRFLSGRATEINRSNLFRSASIRCLQAALDFRTEAPNLATSTRSAALAYALGLLEYRIAHDASLAVGQGSALDLSDARLHLRRELGLRSAARGVIIKLWAQAGRDRRRLATS